MTVHFKIKFCTSLDNILIYLQYRYPEFHRVFRIWRNLQALKHAARGHDPDGIDTTAPGELTVECPACPHLQKNLPANWEDAPLALRIAFSFVGEL